MKSEGYYYYSEHLNNNFKNEHIKKYEFIWKNIKQFEKVERPTPISKNHVEANLSVIKQIFEKDLEWKFKE